MAGLLDPQLDPMTLGLLQASAGLLAPRRQGGGLAGGIAGFGQGLLQGEELLRARAAQANRDRLTNAQIANFESESDYRKAMSAKAQAEVKRQAQKDADAAQFWQMLTTGGGMGAPTPANAARLGQPMQLTPQIAALAAQRGIDLDTLQKVAGAGDWGRSKVARTVEVRGPDGRPRTIQLDEFGRPVGEGYDKPYEKKMQDIGGSVVPFDPYAPTALTKTQTPDGRASNELTRRGQDMTDARARESAEAARRAKDSDDWQTFEQRGVQVNKRTGEVRPLMQDGKPIGARNDDAGKRTQNANDALVIIEQADKILSGGKATGSYLGVGADKAMQAFGVATPGAVETGRLKALQGALMMRMPRMEGPQSNLDVDLYKESVGKIGDATLPVEVRKASLSEVKRLQRKYAGLDESTGGASGSWGGPDPLGMRGGKSDPLGIR